jgi:hypothetical protein
VKRPPPFLLRSKRDQNLERQTGTRHHSLRKPTDQYVAEALIADRAALRQFTEPQTHLGIGLALPLGDEADNLSHV